MKAEPVAEDDGYGTVGYSYVCPKCEFFNRFVDYDLTVHVCEKCKSEVNVDYSGVE